MLCTSLPMLLETPCGLNIIDIYIRCRFILWLPNTHEEEGVNRHIRVSACIVHILQGIAIRSESFRSEQTLVLGIKSVAYTGTQLDESSLRHSTQWWRKTGRHVIETWQVATSRFEGCCGWSNSWELKSHCCDLSFWKPSSNFVFMGFVWQIEWVAVTHLHSNQLSCVIIELRRCLRCTTEQLGATEMNLII